MMRLKLLLVASVIFAGPSFGSGMQDLYEYYFKNHPAPTLSAFTHAVNGYYNLMDQGKIKVHTPLTVIDLSLPSTTERLWVLDMDSCRIMEHTLVAHGKNSGANKAVSFSNKSGSHQSSLGLFLTAETYFGKHGYSLRLDGLEPGINHNARSRAIVMHGADYVSYGFIKKYGRLGRSFGCPAVPIQDSERIIDIVKGGSLLFIYHDVRKSPKNNKLKRTTEAAQALFQVNPCYEDR